MGVGVGGEREEREAVKDIAILGACREPSKAAKVMPIRPHLLHSLCCSQLVDKTICILQCPDLIPLDGVCGAAHLAGNVSWTSSLIPFRKWGQPNPGHYLEANPPLWVSSIKINGHHPTFEVNGRVEPVPCFPLKSMQLEANLCPGCLLHKPHLDPSIGLMLQTPGP